MPSRLIAAATVPPNVLSLRDPDNELSASAAFQDSDRTRSRLAKTFISHISSASP